MRGQFVVVPILALILLFTVPWWTLVLAPDWGTAATVAGTAVFALGLVTMPVAMFRGHARHQDGAARVGDSLLAVIWVLFSWSVLSLVLRAALLGVDDPLRSRIVAAATFVVAAGLLVHGNRVAMRVPPVKATDVVIP